MVAQQVGTAAVFDIFREDPETGERVYVGQASTRGQAHQKVLLWREPFDLDNPPAVVPKYAIVKRGEDPQAARAF